MTLPNRRKLHALARSLSGISKDHDTCVNIDGPQPGTYTSYRVTPEGRSQVLAAFEAQGTLFDLAVSA